MAWCPATDWHPVQCVFPHHSQCFRDRLWIYRHPDKDMLLKINKRMNERVWHFWLSKLIAQVCARGGALSHADVSQILKVTVRTERSSTRKWDVEKLSKLKPNQNCEESSKRTPPILFIYSHFDEQSALTNPSTQLRCYLFKQLYIKRK